MMLRLVYSFRSRLTIEKVSTTHTNTITNFGKLKLTLIFLIDGNYRIEVRLIKKFSAICNFTHNTAQLEACSI